MKKVLYYLPSIIFNVVETVVIILIGMLLRLSILDILLVGLLFGVIRMLTHSAIHYKNWKLCMIWSVVQLGSLFLAYKAGIIVSLIATSFTALILSGKGNIFDIFMWGRK